MAETKRPQIGLAISGAFGRAIAHIGVIEILQEHGIPIDYIAACSSGTFVASSFACGTMEELKETWLKLDQKAIFDLLRLEKNGGGMFGLEKLEELIRKFTRGKNFEDVQPRLNFIACDVETGEPVSLALGDLARASCISSCVPGLFPPALWGNRLLVDGGLFSMVPVNEVKEMGADIVIGVDIAATRYMFKKRYLGVWRGIDLVKRSWPVRLLLWVFTLLGSAYDSSVKFVFYSQSDFLEPGIVDKNPNLLSVLDKAMRISARLHRTAIDHVPTCDIMLSPKVKHFGKIDMENTQRMYLEGRRVALEAIPEIRKLIKEYNWRAQAQVVKLRHV